MGMDHHHRRHHPADRRRLLFGGGGYGRFIGIFAASIGALGSLLSIGGTHAWWSLASFALCVHVLRGLIVLGDDLTAIT